MKIRGLEASNVAAMRRVFAEEIGTGLVVVGDDRAEFHMSAAEARALIREKRDAMYAAGDNDTFYELRGVSLKAHVAQIREETSDDPGVEAFNAEASFEPWIPASENGGVKALPCLTVAGVQVYAYVRREESGRLTLVVSGDFDTADPDITIAGDVVPVEVNMSGRTVWRSVPTDMVKGE